MGFFMSNPNDHAVSIALLNQKFATMEQSLASISKSLEKLASLEMHHSETRHSITRMHDIIEAMQRDHAARLNECDIAQKHLEDRLRKLEDADMARRSLGRSLAWLWGGVGGLVVIEVWRYLGGH